MRLRIGETVHDLEIARRRDGGYIVKDDGKPHDFDIDQLSDETLRFRCNGLMDTAGWFRDGADLYLLHRGIPIAVRDLTRAAPDKASATGRDGKVRASMNGRVVAILVKPGEAVATGQPVVTLEAMKMEHVHVAPVAGTIAAIDVVAGEQVTTGQIVAEIAIDAREP
jgi:geranyl-CoA carboxylase alpha subunit